MCRHNIPIYTKYSDIDQQRAQVCIGADAGIGIDDKSVVIAGIDAGVGATTGCTASCACGVDCGTADDCAAGVRENRGSTTNTASTIIIATIIPYICGAKYIICDAKNKLHNLFSRFNIQHRC